MPLVKGVGDEVLYAALAAAAAPLAVALSPNYVRRQPLSLLQKGAASVSRVFRLLWARVRIWLLRKAQRLLLNSVGGSIDRQRPLTSTRPSLSLEGPASASQTSTERLPQGQEQTCSLADSPRPTNFESDAGSGKMEAEMRRFFGGAEPRERTGSFQEGAGSSGTSNPGETRSTGGEGVVRPPAGEICSVCHDEFTMPCQANCGHWFCAECIMRVWHHGSALAPCRCPICRRTVTLLLLAEGAAAEALGADPPAPSQSQSQSQSQASSSPFQAPVLSRDRRLELLQDVAKYNRLFGGVPVSLWQRLLDMPVLLRRMGRDLVDPTRAISMLHNVRFLVCIVCMGIYVLSPLDIISEGLLGILGLVDDVVFLVCVAFYLTVLYRATLVARASNAPAEGNPPQQQM